MKRNTIGRILAFFPLLIALSSCEGQVSNTSEVPTQVQRPESFEAYWYSGQAEINRYSLSQSRYGEQREGEAVMVFVTEDFLTEAQVKKEYGNAPFVSVLKLNFLKKFITGIYDYSLMTSVFTPVAYLKDPFTQKVTFSAQDWCGQSFGQMNMRERQIHFTQRSYFQSEGDLDTLITATYMEDDVWTRMRLEPQSLPLGKIEMIPSQEFLRLNHAAAGAYQAQASLVLQVNDQETNREFYVYTLQYPSLDRKLVIQCESKFPFRILRWDEQMHVSQPGKVQTTTAVLEETLRAPYWEMNAPSGEAYRDSLGLKYGFSSGE